MRNEAAQKRSGSSSAVVDYSDPFAILNLPERLDDNGGCGSVAKDMKEFLSLFAKFPPLSTVYMEEGKRQSRLVSKFACQQATSLAQNNVIDLDNDLLDNNAPAASLPVVIIDSDEEHSEDQRPSYSFQEVFMIQPSEQVFRKDFRVRNCDENKVSVGEASPSAKSENNKDAGVYLGVEDDESTEEDDDLGDAWMEMSMALESLKDVAVDPSSEQKTSEGGEDCDCEHSFLLKDDLGYVCRICGVIERGIDMIFEFQYNKVKKSTRTCMPDSRNAKDRDLTEVGGVKLSEDGLIVPEISAHPRHTKQMKPHQVEGFNFLVSNLVGDNPRGCILAHAPGTGKTFMIISFMQSYLAETQMLDYWLFHPKESWIHGKRSLNIGKWRIFHYLICTSPQGRQSITTAGGFEEVGQSEEYPLLRVQTVHLLFVIEKLTRHRHFARRYCLMYLQFLLWMKGTLQGMKALMYSNPSQNYRRLGKSHFLEPFIKIT